MIAVIEDSATQLRVKEGDIVNVDLRDVKVGDQIEFDKVCLVDSEQDKKIGTPYVEGASVTGTVLSEIKGPKVIAAQFRRRKDSRTRKGHRQRFLRVKVDKIQL